MKLKESIPSNSLKIIDLYNKIESEFLDTSPDFQRKLVWKKQHKYAFIQTILLNYPFPEIYIASAEMDIQNLKSKEIVVDGQQRLNAIVDYIKGVNDFESQKKIKSFQELSLEEKKDFLNYSVTVKDMKDIGMDNIKEIFKRINSTDYSLNANEVINAQFGDGEFAIFCKQLADMDYLVFEDSTDVIIKDEKRELVNKFLIRNNVFSDNDIKRMFDSNYIMLVTSTLLEGKYFGRNTRINHYLKKYNYCFDDFNQILDKILNSVRIIELLKLSEGSYWYNKANLFTLLIELCNVNQSELSIDKLEFKLIDLENKMDLYFNGNEEEIKILTNDETKYFEVSRQGSHEVSAREHRAKVIQNIIANSKILNEISKVLENEIEKKNFTAIETNNIKYTILIPTITGLKKSIMDATSNVRMFLKELDIHDFEIQNFGPSNKSTLSGKFINDDFSTKSMEISLYRSNGRGDYRIWFSDLNDFAENNNKLIMTLIKSELSVLNLSKFDYTEFLSTSSIE